MFPDASEIKKRRHKLGLNQKQLANLAGVSQSLIAKVESGRIEPRYSKIKAIFQALDNYGVKEQKKVKEIMKTDLLYAKKSDLLGAIASKMKKRYISQVPVLDKGRNVGSISDATIVQAINEHGVDYEKLKVEDVMDSSFPTVDEDTPLDTIKPLLKTYRVVLVTKKGKVVGIVSRSNLF